MPTFGLHGSTSDLPFLIVYLHLLAHSPIFNLNYVGISQISAAAIWYEVLRCVLGPARYDSATACYRASIPHMIDKDTCARRITRDVAIICLFHIFNLQDRLSSIKPWSLAP